MTEPSSPQPPTAPERLAHPRLSDVHG